MNRWCKLTLTMPLVTCLTLVSFSKVEGQQAKGSSGAKAPVNDQIEKYARWWKKRADANPKFGIRRDKNGKRVGRVFRVPTNPPSVTAEKAEQAGIVRDPTFVLGVNIGKQARAYPIHAMGFELLNDTLGGEPIATSW